MFYCLPRSSNLLVVIFVNNLFNAVDRIQERADRVVVINGIDKISNVFRHIYPNIPFALHKLFIAVNQVGGKELVYKAFFIKLVEFIVTVNKKAESSEREYTVAALRFKLFGNVKQRVARRNHIVNNNKIFTGNVVTQKFVCFYGVASVYNNRIISAFVEHTELDA